MGLDIRTPIGMMFSVLGIILTATGLLTSGEVYHKSLGINVNLGWGVVLLIFGVVMLIFGLRSGKERAEAQHVGR